MDDLISRSWLLSEYDKRHKGPPGGARKLIEEAPSALGTDGISRQAAIDYFVTNVGFHDEDGYPIEDECELREIWTGYFDGIPSAQPDTYWKEQCQSYEQTINKLRESLSTQPEIIRCKDCKHRDKYGCCKHWKGLAMGDIQIATDDNDFCSQAERRTE